MGRKLRSRVMKKARPDPKPDGNRAWQEEGSREGDERDSDYDQVI